MVTLWLAGPSPGLMLKLSMDGFGATQGGGRMVKCTVSIAELWLKVILLVYRPEANPARETPTLTFVLPPALIKPLAGWILSQDAFEEAAQEPAPQPFPLLMVTPWLAGPSPWLMVKLSVSGLGATQGGGRMVKCTVSISEPGLKAICPV